MRSLKPTALALATLSIFAAGPARAQSLEQMAGQMIVVGFSGTSANAKSVTALRAEIAAGLLGGVMYLKTNVGSLKAVREMNAAFRAASPAMPPFLTLDQEGGAVERLTEEVGFREIPSAQAVAAGNAPDAAEAIYARMARGIADVGFSVNFGPVVDLSTNPRNQVIAKYGRAFSADAQTVATYAAAFVEGHREAGVLTALKHFPGHGSSTADSHEGFVDITRSWDKSELEPYRALIGAGAVDMVMVGHLYHADYSGADAQLPSSLSPEWVTGVLRGELGFDGVVISDDLEMGAIREHFSMRDTILMSVRAGVDVLLFSNTVKPRASLTAEIRSILVAEAEADPAFAAQIKRSYERIAALKKRIGGGSIAALEAPVPMERPDGL